MDTLIPWIKEASKPGPGHQSALISFAIYMLMVFALAWLAGRVRRGKKEFVSEYFLGSRGLGMWAFALTFAATNASGGSFMGFPALIYTHGWILALWIASYMVVPLVTTGLLAKRLNQVSRIAGAVTVPDILRARFASPVVGLVATGLLTFFMFFYLLAQFKAGSQILATLLQDMSLFQEGVRWVAGWKGQFFLTQSTDADYLLCLLLFAGTVIVYTTYGGFRAVVWTDVMQGIVMVIGVMIMLVLVLGQVGGLTQATQKLATLEPPKTGMAFMQWKEAIIEAGEIPKGTWLESRDGQVVRLAEPIGMNPGDTQSDVVKVLVEPNAKAYDTLESWDLSAWGQLVIEGELQGYARGDGEKGAYVRAPGPSQDSELGYLSIGMAFSFFVFWAFGGAGQPSNMVRQMAFTDSKVLKRSIIVVALYYSAIYFPLVIIFCCAKVMMPGMEITPDRIMPEMARTLSVQAGAPWLTGLIVAAPFAAVMSSVDSFLLMVSSGVVRDIYQHHIRPDASEQRIKVMTYAATTVIGLGAVLAVLNPPTYLQHLIVFATGGLAGSFLMPMALALFWRGVSAGGIIAGMMGGCLTHLSLYIAGYLLNDAFRAYSFLGIEPFMWDVAGSTLATLVVSRFTQPLDTAHIQRYFGAKH
jgi:sodium/pantothenate symporter